MGSPQSITPRQRDAERIAEGLELARKALLDASDRCLLWADDVAQDVEKRLGLKAGESTPEKLADPEYGNSLDLCGDIQKALAQVARLAERIKELEL